MAIYVYTDEALYPLESIVTKQKANSSGMIYIPYGDANWKVSIDDTVVQNGGSSTYFSGYTVDSEHIVAIEPITVSYGRAKNYKWYDNNNRHWVIEIIQDKSYIGFANSATDTGNSFRASEYRGCSNLINTAEEYLPDTVTTIGNSFREYQYRDCSNITEAQEEILPNTVTSIGTNFRVGQYRSCTNLTEASEEVLPDTVTTIGSSFRTSQYDTCTSLTSIKGWKDLDLGSISYYRNNQFTGCSAQKTVKVLSDVGTAGQSNTLRNIYVSEVQVPTVYLNNFINSTKYPRSNITDSKFVGY